MSTTIKDIIACLEVAKSYMAILLTDMKDDLNRSAFCEMLRSDISRANDVLDNLRLGNVDEILKVKEEASHWKANHDNQVRLKHILSDRLDLPLERSQAAEYYEAVQELSKKTSKILIRLLQQHMERFGAIDGAHDPERIELVESLRELDELETRSKTKRS